MSELFVLSGYLQISISFLVPNSVMAYSYKVVYCPIE